MAFRASNILPERGLKQAKLIANNVKSLSGRFAAQFASTGGTADNIYQIVDALRNTKAELQSIAAISGIGAYAQAQENDAGYDIAAEFTAMIAQIDAVITEIGATFPVDGSGFHLGYTWAAGGERVPRTFSVVALSGLTAELNVLVSSIV